MPWCGQRRLPGLANDRDDGVDLDGGAFGKADFGEHAGHGRGNLGVDLVGGDLEERLVFFDGVADGFLSHLVIVPSKIDSPIWGMMTSVGMHSSFAVRGRRRAGPSAHIGSCRIINRGRGGANAEHGEFRPKWGGLWSRRRRSISGGTWSGVSWLEIREQATRVPESVRDCGGLRPGAQGVEALENSIGSPKTCAELPRRPVGERFERGQALGGDAEPSDLLFQTGDRAISNAAGIDKT